MTTQYQLPKRGGHFVTHPDGSTEFVPDAKTAARGRRAMLAFHEKAARAYAAHGRHDIAAQAKAAADRTRAKIVAE